MTVYQGFSRFLQLSAKLRSQRMINGGTSEPMNLLKDLWLGPIIVLNNKQIIVSG